jgi:nucleotide-binding universal stress UspA family protein
MNTVIVGFDGSEHAQRALERAASIVDDGGSLVVVSAARLSTLTRDIGTSAVDPIEAEAACEALEKAKALLKGRGGNIRFVESHGDPAESLVRQAEEDKADLIVVGTRGLNFAQRALLGSVSTKVVHHAPCDVLIVR